MEGTYYKNARHFENSFRQGYIHYAQFLRQKFDGKKCLMFDDTEFETHLQSYKSEFIQEHFKSVDSEARSYTAKIGDKRRR